MISYRKILLWIAFVLGLFVLQTSLFPIFSWNGVSVNLMLVFTVSWSLLYGARRGAFLGSMTGLLQDLATGMFFGMDVFVLTIIGYVTGAFSRNVFKDPVFLPAMATMWATTAHYFFVLVLMLLLGYSFSLLYIGKTLLPALCFNIFFAYPVYRATNRMQEWTKKRRGGR